MANFYAKAFPQSGASGGGGGGVTSLNAETGALSITAGTGIAITTPTSSTIQVASTSAGDVTLSAFGSSPNANAASLSSQALTLQPASASFPGGVSTTTQTFAGDKTFSGVILASDGTNTAPGISFSSDPNTGLYRLGADDVAIAAGSYAGLEVKKSTGSFANVGMGSAPSASDNYPVLIQRSNASAGTYIQVSNPATAASSKSCYQLATDLGANTGEVSVFSAAASADAYTGRMTVRASDSTVGLSLIAGDGATNTIRHYVAGDYTSAGNALEVTAQKALNLPQSLASASATTPASGLLMMNDSGVFKTKNSSGTVASLSGSNTGDQTITLTGDVTGSGTGSFATTYAGTVPLNKGGTGQTTKAAAFDALQPMTTGGDLIYGGASGTGTRLANGSSGQALISAGGTSAPVWTTILATQADQETGTSTTTYVSPGRQQYHNSAAKAWVMASQTGSNNASYNISSITNNATGDNTYNFTTAFSSSSYAVAGAGGLNTTSMRVICVNVTQSTTQCRLQTTNSDGGSLADGSQRAIFFGDQ
jgi:hypothetical protein